MKAGFRDKDLFISLFRGDVYAVGGFVRDALRGNPTEEVDLLVARHSLEEVLNKLMPHGKVDVVGKSFGVIKFTKKGKTYDIALPREDKPKKSAVRGHKDFLITADPDLPLEKDLKRRDFRCNSIALRLEDGSIIDPFGGRRDIEEKILRLTDPSSFPDDPLRVLRAARFASVLEFTVDADIYEVSKKIELSGLSVERINEELFKMLLHSSRPSVGLEELFKLSALRSLFPELYALTLSIQDSLFHPEKDAFGHHTVWIHTLITVDQATRLARSYRLDRQRTLALLLAALFHDLGKPATAAWEYKRGRMTITNKGHDLASARMAKDILNRQKIFQWNGFPLRKTVLALISCHHRASELWQNREVVTKKAYNRLAAEVKGEIALLLYLDAADRAGRKKTPIKRLDRQGLWLRKKFEELNVTKETIRPLIMGRDLLQLGVPPGPEMGGLLKKLYQMQLDSEFETKEQGLKAAEEWIKGCGR